MKADQIYAAAYILVGLGIICASWLTNDMGNRFIVQLIGCVFFIVASIFAAKIIINQNN